MGIFDRIVNLLSRGPDETRREEADPAIAALLHALAAGDAKTAEQLAGRLPPNVRGADGRPLLHAAVEAGMAGVVRQMLARGCSPDSRDAGGIVPLLIAVRHKRREIVTLLLGKGANPDLGSPRQEFPLLEALQAGDAETALLLVRKIRNAGVADRELTTPLHAAVRLKHPELVSALISCGGEIFLKDRKGRTPVSLAEEAGDPELLRLLFRCHARRQLPKDPRLLYKVVYEDQRLLAEALIEEGASLAVEPGRYSFMHVAKSGEMVRLLAGKGVPLETPDGEGRSPLHHAVKLAIDGRNPESCEAAMALLELGADPNHRADDGSTPFVLLQDLGDQERLQPLLRRMAESGGIALRAGELHRAAEAGEVSRLRELLGGNADQNTPDAFGRTPLHLAAAGGHLEAVKLLVERGAEVNFRQGREETGSGYRCKYMTPLHRAVLAKRLDLVTYLLDHGADIDRRTSFGATPLVLACQAGLREIVAALLERNPSLDLADEYEGTPLHIAAKTGNLELMKLLVARGAALSIEIRAMTPLDAATTVDTRRLLWQSKATGAIARTEARCHICGLPYFHGSFQTGMSDFGTVARTCSVCGKDVCELCSSSSDDGNDNVTKACHACREQYGLKRRSGMACWSEAAEKLQGRPPEAAYACPVCGKSWTVREALAELAVCTKCKGFYCPGCSGRGWLGSGEYCAVCAKQDREFFDGRVAMRKEGETRFARNCPTCGALVKGVPVDSWNGVYTSGIVRCDVCGKDVCPACSSFSGSLKTGGRRTCRTCTA